MEAGRQGMQQEAADELVGIERHRFGLAGLSIVLPGEGDVAIGECDEPAVGDGDAMGVAAEIGEHLFGAAERRLGVDHPVDAPQLVEPDGEGGRFGKIGEIAEETERTCRRESTRTGRKKPARQAIQCVPSGERPPPGTTQWICGWCCRVWPQVWSTAVTPTWAPRWRGSAAMVVSVSAAARNRIA